MIWPSLRLMMLCHCLKLPGFPPPDHAKFLGLPSHVTGSSAVQASCSLRQVPCPPYLLARESVFTLCYNCYRGVLMPVPPLPSSSTHARRQPILPTHCLSLPQRRRITRTRISGALHWYFPLSRFALSGWRSTISSSFLDQSFLSEHPRHRQPSATVGIFSSLCVASNRRWG